VTLTVTDNGGLTASTSRTVTITAPNQPPVANFSATPSTTTTGTPIALSAATSFDPDGSIVGYAWTFGDGTTGSGVTVSKSYATAGTYTVTLTVTDNGGLTGTTTGTVTITSGGGSTTVWVEDTLPVGAVTGGSESFAWITSNPAPFSGTRAHQSGITSGIHQHYFVNATSKLAVGVGDTLFTYVYLDPANPPQAVMLQFYDGSWEHRAYWGANLIPWGGTYRGPLPPSGQWVRLDVPAAQVGLEGHTLNGMAFTLYGGRATWDYSGKTATGGN
jgi:PKD repeat protein